VFENMVLRRISGPKRDERIGDWRKLHNKELHNLYSSPNAIGMITSGRVRWIGHVASMEKKSNEYSNFVGNPEGKRPLGKPRHMWKSYQNGS
jgi:hypothetical protein